jgi:uncharacterized protein involved in cysteine biosynthesis
LTDLHAGLTALPRGLFYLATTRGVKRWLLPPVLLTFIAFSLLFAWAWRWVNRLIDATRIEDLESLPIPDGWLRNAVEFLLVKTAFLTGLAHLSAFFLVLAVGALVSLWAFSIVYEAIAGPFLDEIQGRIETRWFGRNPRNEISRPTQLSSGHCARVSLVAGLFASAGPLLWWYLPFPFDWIGLVVGGALPFALAAARNREYGRWLGWVLRVEGGTLWVSVKASLLAGFLLVGFLWVELFIPVVGHFVYAGIAGFCTALTLLDIPFSRRQWPLRTRLAFLARNLPAVVAFGGVASLLFVLPVIGPVVMVPAASIGGQWLICSLDKDGLRPRERRIFTRERTLYEQRAERATQAEVVQARRPRDPS